MTDAPGRDPEKQARPHAPTGRFERSLEVARRDARCAELRAQGWSHARIGAEVGLVESSVRAAIGRVMRETVQEAGDELRTLELGRLDGLWATALGVMNTDHVMVSNGRVIRTDDGKPMLDDGPKLQAIDRLLRIQERRAKLMGLDAAVKADLRVSNGVDRNIEQFAEEFGIMAELAAAAEAGAAEGGEAEAP